VAGPRDNSDPGRAIDPAAVKASAAADLVVARAWLEIDPAVDKVISEAHVRGVARVIGLEAARATDRAEVRMPDLEEVAVGEPTPSRQIEAAAIRLVTVPYPQVQKEGVAADVVVEARLAVVVAVDIAAVQPA
jgi:hypothetical protein